MYKAYVAHQISDTTLVIFFNEGPPIFIASDNPQFAEIADMLRSGKYDEVVEASDKALSIVISSKGKVRVVDGAICIDGVALPTVLSDRLIEHVDAGYPTEPLENFWDNLKDNESNESIADLYTFLEKNSIPLTPDGHFIAYKKINRNWLDVRTGKISNRPGDVVEMAREDVDPDRNNTCSAGLHVAAWNYMGSYSGSRVVAVKVNPQDVVAVPTDYNREKMRVCKYKVLHEIENEYSDSLYEESDELEFDDFNWEDQDVEECEIVVTKSVTLIADASGHCRVPGRFIRKLGFGHGHILRLVEFAGDCFILTNEESELFDDDGDVGFLPIDEDNSVILQSEFLAFQKISLDVAVLDSETYLEISSQV
jgi:hypothetical protein